MNGRFDARSLVAPVVTPLRGAAVARRTRRWPDRSRLFVLGDALGWALDDEAAYVAAVARDAGYDLGPPAWARFARRQVVFHTSHFAALDPLWTGSSHRLGMAYFHGRPGTPGFPEFDRAFESLARDPDRFDRDPGDAPRDGAPRRRGRRRPGPGAPDPDRDRARSVPARRRRASRRRPGGARARRRTRSSSARSRRTASAWGTAYEPKPIKGPDVLVEALALAHGELERLVVLLTGPARGYVRARARAPRRAVSSTGCYPTGTG